MVGTRLKLLLLPGTLAARLTGDPPELALIVSAENIVGLLSAIATELSVSGPTALFCTASFRH